MNSFIKILNPICNRNVYCIVNLKPHSINYSTPGLSLGKAKKPKGPVLEKKVIPVETDPHKLVKYVCGSNILKEGNDIELKPDSEYPDWLWTLYTGKPKSLQELDPSTIEYWKKVRHQGMKKNNKLKSLSKM